MRTCTLCNGTLQPGHGRAIFTAECTDSFHFQCINSYLNLGNRICPICQAKWNDIPFQYSTSDVVSSKKARIRTVDFLHLGPTPAVLPQSPALSSSNRHRKSFLQASEPDVFNDDEPLESIDIKSINVNRVDIKTYPEVSAVQRSTSQENFTVLINLQAQANNVSHVSQASRAPIDLVTVLDVSSSMKYTKIELLKKAMGFLIQNLGPSDRLSVIAFSSTANRLFPLRRMTESGKEHALQAVNSLFTRNGTDILQGLRRGTKVIKDRREKNPVCSIMLLSDGKDTLGNKAHFLRRDFKYGIHVPVHTFGFGVRHDPILLHSISQACKGTFSFIETESVIQDAFAQCIGGLLSVVVQDLQVFVQSVHPDLRLGQLKAGSYSTRLTNDNQTGTVDVGDLYQDEERDCLVVLVNVPAVPIDDSSNETNLVNVWCVYKDPFSKETMTTEVNEVKIRRPDIVEKEWVVVSMEVDRQRNRLQAADALAQSRAAAERGDLSSAWSILDSCRSDISDSASSQAGDKLCAALEAELKEVRTRMSNMQLYESSGRAYVLSGMSSHSGQRASARSESTDSAGFVHIYQTPSMVNMLSRSQLNH